VTDPGPVRVAVLPARGGSKRIPGKNVRLLAGRPLIAWAIEACLASLSLDDVIVSTDDDDIAEAALAAGARVPFRRPPELSDDHTPLVPVIAHAIATLADQGVSIAAACCVYPTAATIRPEDIDGGWALKQSLPQTPYVVSVVRYGHPIQRALALDADHGLSLDSPEHASTRTQDLPPRWHDAGQFVWGEARAWLAGTAVLTHAAGYPMPAWRALDLDTEDDWARAQVIHEVLRRGTLG
jgi:N-acylneuraminate cytidylyltransferase